MRDAEGTNKSSTSSPFFWNNPASFVTQITDWPADTLE
jgi:hypothetical protein